MNRIDLLIKIIKSSLNFDLALENSNIDEMMKYSDEYKNNLDELLIDHDKLNDIFDKIGQINEYAIKYIKKVDRKGKNTLVLFYSSKCEHSINFLVEWNILLNLFMKKINMIKLDCDNLKYIELSIKFNIKKFPTILYITPTHVHNYDGIMSSKEIIKKFLLD
jgi:hypothetical protein